MLRVLLFIFVVAVTGIAIANGGGHAACDPEPGYAYSDAIAKSGVVWDADSLGAYLANPSSFLPGTRMASAPIRDSVERASIACYLSRLTDTANE